MQNMAVGIRGILLFSQILSGIKINSRNEMAVAAMYRKVFFLYDRAILRFLLYIFHTPFHVYWPPWGFWKGKTPALCRGFS